MHSRISLQPSRGSCFQFLDACPSCFPLLFNEISHDLSPAHQRAARRCRTSILRVALIMETPRDGDPLQMCCRP
jgi:hypothetical protein